MRYPVLNYIEELDLLLLEGSLHAGLYVKSSPTFISQTNDWLDSVESSLRSKGEARVASVSSAKMRIVSAVNGAFSAVQVSPQRRVTRKFIAHIASESLTEVFALLENIRQDCSNRRDEATKYVRQAVLLFDQQKLIFVDSTKTRSDSLCNLVTSMQSHPQTSTAMRHVLTQVSLVDIIRILDETLSLWGIKI